METIWDSHLNEKLRILADAAKYDAACTSSGVDRKNGSMGTGNAVACGICHSFLPQTVHFSVEDSVD